MDIAEGEECPLDKRLHQSKYRRPSRDVEVMRIHLLSTSDPTQIYTITAIRNPARVKCNCKGFRTTGRCKHIRFYKKIITDFWSITSGEAEEKRGK